MIQMIKRAQKTERIQMETKATIMQFWEDVADDDAPPNELGTDAIDIPPSPEMCFPYFCRSSFFAEQHRSLAVEDDLASISSVGAVCGLSLDGDSVGESGPSLATRSSIVSFALEDAFKTFNFCFKDHEGLWKLIPHVSQKERPLADLNTMVLYMFIKGKALEICSSMIDPIDIVRATRAVDAGASELRHSVGLLRDIRARLEKEGQEKTRKFLRGLFTWVKPISNPEASQAEDILKVLEMVSQTLITITPNSVSASRSRQSGVEEDAIDAQQLQKRK